VAAVALVLRVRLRQHWRSWLALAAVVALVGGFVMAAASTGREPRLPFLILSPGTVTTLWSTAATRYRDWPAFPRSP
jgi:hypothetical protein